MTEKKMMEWIDNATYEQLLKKWRHAPSGDPFFTGKVGSYYSKKIRRKREEVGNSAHIVASKNIG
jgi:hypothetical protein